MNETKTKGVIKFPSVGVDFSFKILENILVLKDYKTREDVLRVAQSMAKVACATIDYGQEVKNGYMEAFEKLQALSFEEMMEIKEIIS